MALTILVTLKQGIACHNNCNGTLQAEITGTVGTPPVSYAWEYDSGSGFVSIGTNSYLLSSCCSGSYRVTVTDGASNYISNTYVLTNPAVISATVSEDGASCTGRADGSIVVSGTTGGVGTYTYHWSGPNGYSTNTQSISNLRPGTYILTITDSNGCIKQYTKNITNGKTLNPHLSITNANPCSYTCNATATVAPTGGNSPYFYLWNTGSTTSTVTGLCAGTYTCVITDVIGCVYNVTVVIPSTPKLELTYFVTDPTVSSPASGSIITNTTGGQDPYTYLWSTTSTSNQITGLSAGTYTLTVTDDNGCTIEHTFILSLGCDNLSLSEFKVFQMKLQCCVGNLMKRHNSFIRQGRQDLADKLRPNLYLAKMILDRFYCIDDISEDTCWSCTDIQALMDLAKKICDCDCCNENSEEIVHVRWNSETNRFDVI